ncbi:MAG: pilus assembly protein [Gammaproteobacteria bacterium]|nr:pilus assembly protein [Gammaproteobacteria bacterium]
MYISYLSKNSLRLYRQRGSALIIALVFLLAMTLIGVTGMQSTTQQEKMAGNVLDRNLAFQAAEAALLAAENALDQRGNAAPGVQPNTFAPPASWLAFNWGGPQPINYNGALMGISAPPSYVIEYLGNIAQTGGSGSSQVVNNRTSLGDDYFRITARGIGGSPNAVVILQSVYRM